MGKNIHVTHRRDGSWAVIGEGNQRASSKHTTQKAATAAARPLAKKNASELVVHGSDNKIRDKESFGSDPCPPKDSKH